MKSILKVPAGATGPPPHWAKTISRMERIILDYVCWATLKGNYARLTSKKLSVFTGYSVGRINDSLRILETKTLVKRKMSGKKMIGIWLSPLVGFNGPHGEYEKYQRAWDIGDEYFRALFEKG